LNKEGGLSAGANGAFLANKIEIVSEHQPLLGRIATKNCVAITANVSQKISHF
jgi:hypothetical protein